jgi:hypothetical protein
MELCPAYRPRGGGLQSGHKALTLFPKNMGLSKSAQRVPGTAFPQRALGCASRSGNHVAAQWRGAERIIPMRTTHVLALATMLLAGTATAASACGAQASLKSGVTAATAQDFSAVSKKNMKKMKMSKATSKKMAAKKMMKKRSTTGGPATMNPTGGPGTGTTPDSKSTSTGNAGTGAGAPGGQSAGTATNSGK